eukprot:g6228.t1
MRSALQRGVCRTRSLASASSSIPVLVDTDAVLVASQPVTPFAMNQYLVGCKKTGQAALVDAGDDDASRWVTLGAAHGMEITQILQTHAHIDHVAGLERSRAELPGAAVKLHPEDGALLQTVSAQAAMFGLGTMESPRAEGIEDIADGDVLVVGALAFEVLHTPGHCPGHVCFYCEGASLLLSGDLLFAGSIGRTDFPAPMGCCVDSMRASLRRVLELPDETLVLPGHNQSTTIGDERASNPFLQPHFLG